MPSFGQVLRSGKRRFVSAAAFSLYRKTWLADPVEAMRRLNDELLEDAEVGEPPVPLDVLASFVGIGEVRILEMRGAGRLVPLPNSQFRVEVRASDPVGRRNFSTAHEIGHLLIPSYHENPTTKEDALTGEFPKDEEEYLCDIAARNLLLPESVFRKRCSELEPSIDGLLQLSDIFQASIEAVALRLDQLCCWKCIPVIWEMGLKESQKNVVGQTTLLGFEELSEPIEEFRVKFHAGNEATMFFPKTRHIPADSSMVLSCRSEGRFKGSCVIPTSKRDVERNVEAVAVPYRNEHAETKQRIVSLVYA